MLTYAASSSNKVAPGARRGQRRYINAPIYGIRSVNDQQLLIDRVNKIINDMDLRDAGINERARCRPQFVKVRLNRWV